MGLRSHSRHRLRGRGTASAVEGAIFTLLRNLRRRDGREQTQPSTRDGVRLDNDPSVLNVDLIQKIKLEKNLKNPVLMRRGYA